MKKLILLVSSLFCALILSNGIQAQNLPVDPSYKVGKLENGMTYYIRHNALPENRAEFYLATNVGALQETPDQDGLAHFLEHMCFNGTKNFPEKTLLNWLESIGASFGGNINASTGIEQTQYMLNNIPLTRPSIVDSCLLIMHDYSHFVTLDPKEIDAERGVILEEKRTRNTSSWRTFIESKKYLFKGTKYADVSLIGSEENLKTFQPASLENFYHTWYRPDMQALIVVGDIDVDEIEAKIKQIFSDIPAVQNPQAKEPCIVPGNAEPIIGVITDKELTNTTVEMYWKSDAAPLEFNSTPNRFIADLLEDIVGNVMNERLSDIAAKADAPFLGAGFGCGRICAGTEAVFAEAASKDGESLSALEALYTEALKLSRFGATDDEISRAKDEILASFETAAKKADTRKNPEFIQPAMQNFFYNNYLLDPATKLQLAQNILPQLPAAAINQALAQLVTKENLVTVITSPDKEGIVIPNEEQVREVLAKVEASDIKPNVVEDIPAAFLDPQTLKGSDIKDQKAHVFDSELITLKNGVRVILRPNDKEKDRIIFKLYKQGGRSLVADKDLYSLEDNVWTLYNQNTGVAEFKNSTVNKMLSGKVANVSSFIGSLTHGINGSSTVKDFETAMQLAYLLYTQPRFDQEEYDLGIKQIQAVLPNLMSNSSYKLQSQLYKTIYNSPRRFFISDETLQKANLETLAKVYRNLFNGANGLTMIVVGDFQKEQVLPLIQKYIGSIAKGGKATTWKDCGDGIVDGTNVNDFTAVMEQPKVTVFQLYKANAPYSVQADVTTEALSYILRMIYTTTLREDEGGTYGAGVSASVTNGPNACRMLQVSFDTNEDKADKLRQLAIDGMRRLATDGPTAEEFDKTVKNLAKKLPENKLRSNFWMESLQTWEDFGIDEITGYERAINALTPEAVKAAAHELLFSGNFDELIMRPQK